MAQKHPWRTVGVFIIVEKRGVEVLRLGAAAAVLAGVDAVNDHCEERGGEGSADHVHP